MHFKDLKVPKLYRESFFGKNGVITKKEGNIYYFDFNATVSNDGTSKDPKFQFKMFFEKCLFPVIEKFVCDGGPFEGFSTVIYGDNDGAQKDAKLYKHVVNFCKGGKKASGTSGTSDTTYECTVS